MMQAIETRGETAVAVPFGVTDLSYKQKWQLAADCNTNPAAFCAVRDFVLGYADARQQLSDLLTEHGVAQSALNRQELEYDQLIIASQPSNRDPFTKRRIKWMGLAWGVSKLEQRDRTDQLFKTATAFSHLMALHCSFRLNGAKLLIMGQNYTYEEGYLALTDTQTGKPLIFADIAEVRRQHALEIQKIPSIQRRPETSYAQLAPPAAWNHLLHGLACIALTADYGQ